MGIRTFRDTNMNNELSKIIEKYIFLCSQMCKCADDYTKEKVAKHNKAMKALIQLKKKLHADANLTEQVYAVLLKSKDIYVRQSAATECLSLNIYTEESAKILKEICLQGNRMAAMGARRTLLIWEGKLDPNDPF